MNRDERAQYGPQIRAERARQGMSQAELADAAGTTSRTIGMVERGDCVPQAAILSRILDALSIDPAVSPAPASDDPELDTLMAALRPLLGTLDQFRRTKAMPKLIEILTEELRTQAFEELLMMSDDQLVQETQKSPPPSITAR